MAQYQVQAPDGHTITLQGPAGATQAQVLAQAQSLYRPASGPPGVNEMMGDLATADAHGDTQLAQTIAGRVRQAQNPTGAIAGEPDLGSAGNALLAGGIHFVHQLPFVGDAAITAGRAINDVSNGRGFDWQKANQEAHQTIESAQQQHPVASTVGGVAGGIDTGVIGGGVLKAAGALPGVVGRGSAALQSALALRKGQVVANAARLAAVGGGAAAAQAGGEQAAGGNLDQVIPAAVSAAPAGAAAALVSAPVAAVAGAGARALGGAVTGQALPGKVALALSKVFGEDPSDLQTAFADHTAAAGAPPSMAELANYKQQGLISGLAKDSPEIGARLQARVVQAAQDRSDRLNAMFSNTAGSQQEAVNARTAQGDIDYSASRAGPDFAVSTDPAQELGGVSPADHVQASILPQAGLSTADRVRIGNDLQNGTLSAQDAQLMRTRLAVTLARSHSPAVETSIADLDSILGHPSNAEANAALNTARSNFAANSRTVEGAQHGATILNSGSPREFASTVAATAPGPGTAIAPASAMPPPSSVGPAAANPEFARGLRAGASDALATASGTPTGATSLAGRLAMDANLYSKIATVYGQPAADALQRLGAAETAANSSLRGSVVGPSAPNSDLGQVARDAANVVGAVASHGTTWKLGHALRLIRPLGMSDKVAGIVAGYLTDPRMAQQGINLLIKAGASAQQIRSIALHAAATSGVLAGAAVGDSMETQQ